MPAYEKIQQNRLDAALIAYHQRALNTFVHRRVEHSLRIRMSSAGRLKLHSGGTVCGIASDAVPFYMQLLSIPPQSCRSVENTFETAFRPVGTGLAAHTFP